MRETSSTAMADHRDIVSALPFMRKAQPVETVAAKNLDAKRFQRFVDENAPLLIKGAADHWPARQRWTEPGYLLDRTGGQHVNIYPHVNYCSVERQHVGRRNVSFEEAWTALHDGGSGSVAAAWPISNAPIFPTPDHVYRNLKEDIPGFDFLPDPQEPFAFPRWRGFLYRNAGTSWHYHQTDCTLMTQIEGSKTIGLLRPDAAFVTLANAFLTDAIFDDLSMLDTCADRLAPLVATIEPGDAVFLPPFWWHGVEAKSGFGITVPFCWRPPTHVLGSLHLPANRRFVRYMLKNWRKKPHPKMLALTGVGALLAAGRNVARAAWAPAA